MKKIIIFLVLIGFGVIGYNAISATKDPYYTDWLKNSKNLPTNTEDQKRLVEELEKQQNRAKNYPTKQTIKVDNRMVTIINGKTFRAAGTSPQVFLGSLKTLCSGGTMSTMSLPTPEILEDLFKNHSKELIPTLTTMGYLDYQADSNPNFGGFADGGNKLMHVKYYARLDKILKNDYPATVRMVTTLDGPIYCVSEYK